LAERRWARGCCQGSGRCHRRCTTASEAWWRACKMAGVLAGVGGSLGDFLWCSGCCCLCSSCRDDGREAEAGASGLGDGCPISARLEADVLESGVWVRGVGETAGGSAGDSAGGCAGGSAAGSAGGSAGSLAEGSAGGSAGSLAAGSAGGSAEVGLWGPASASSSVTQSRLRRMP